MPQNSGRAAVEALARGLAAAADKASQRLLPELFQGRFSTKVARALVRGGIDAPERLLFMDAAKIKIVPGIGPSARKEIELYRTRFLPVPEPIPDAEEIGTPEP